MKNEITTTTDNLLEITTETCSRFQYLLDAKELTHEELMELAYLKTLVRKVKYWNLEMWIPTQVHAE